MTPPWWLLVLPLAAAAVSGPLRVQQLARRSVQAPLETPNSASPGPGPGPGALRCFQLTGPVLAPEGLLVGDDVVGLPPRKYKSCRAVLVRHVFANSYGKPFVGDYTPPDCDFGRVVFNLSVVSEGRQFDRLATLWAGDVEVWRTSTAEPKPPPGIVWTHVKDMTAYLALWKTPQRLILDLGNLVNDKYTGSFNVTLTAAFFDESPRLGPAAAPADLVVPVSARKSRQGLGSVWVFPENRPADRVELPPNVRRAVLSVAATGQGAEEFWWSNVPQQITDDFAARNVTVPGLGSFREVRIYIDGALAGLAWPFPVVFTGGIAPPLHRPLVGLQAFDLEEQLVEMTPWLGLLCDGSPHTISFDVVAENNTTAVGNWVLSAKVFVWLSEPGSVTQGEPPRVSVSKPSYHVHVGHPSGGLVRYRQVANRDYSSKGTLHIDDVETSSESHQVFSAHNDGAVSTDGTYQRVDASYGGSDKATLHLDSLYERLYRYPISSSTLETRPADGPVSMRLDANLSQGIELAILGESAVPTGLESFVHKLPEQRRGVELSTRRDGKASFSQSRDGSSSGGVADLKQTFSLGARGYHDGDKLGFHANPLLYLHNVSLVGEALVRNHEFVYKADMKLPERTVVSSDSRFALEDEDKQYAPVMADGLSGGSMGFSAKNHHLALEPSA